MLYVALDVGRKSCYATVKDKEGNIMMQERFNNDVEEFSGFLESVNDEARIVIEASYCYEHLYDYAESKGYKVVLANPLKTKAIADARIKTDKLDSDVLADLLRANLIAESYIPPQHIRDLKNMVRHRYVFVRQRTALKNQIHALLAREGIKIPYTDMFGKTGLRFLSTVKLKQSHRYALDNYLLAIQHLNKTIDKVSKDLIDKEKEFQEVHLLKTIPGISDYSALLLLSEIGDIHRFASPNKLLSYAGLIPSTYQSGNVTCHGHITKRGSNLMRWVLIQAAHIAVRQPNFLQAFYLRIKNKKGGKIAIVATAKKVLVVIYHMLKRQQPFKARGHGALNFS